MPHPDFYPEGTTPRIKDTRYRLLVKTLGERQNQGGASAQNNPRRKDTLRVVVNKLRSALGV